MLLSGFGKADRNDKKSGTRDAHERAFMNDRVALALHATLSADLAVCAAPGRTPNAI
jgi:hypothetical protein